MRAGTALALAAILCLTSLAAKAEDEATSPQLKRCLDSSGGVTADMDACLSDELARQDKRLNQVYQVLMRNASAKQAAELRNAQRAWLAYREVTCGLYDTFGGGGTIDRLNVGSCEVDILARRVKFLENLRPEE